MEGLQEVFDNLKGWPWTIFKSLNPIFKVLITLLALAAWAPEPLDIIGLAIWGVIAGIFFQATTATAVVVGFGLAFWFISQLIESIVVFVIAIYLVPGFIGGMAAMFGYDATDTLFE